MEELCFSVVPRGTRTGWTSADGRILFSRCKNGWSATNRSTYKGGLAGDRQQLIAAGIIGSGAVADIIFETLEMAKDTVAQAFKGDPNPPDLRLYQRPISYQLECERFDGPFGIPFRLKRHNDGWRIITVNTPTFRRQGVDLYELFSKLAATKFSSRKLALKALERACNSHLEELKDLQLIDFRLKKPVKLVISLAS